jgi:hypothetical protein
MVRRRSTVRFRNGALERKHGKRHPIRLEADRVAFLLFRLSTAVAAKPRRRHPDQNWPPLRAAEPEPDIETFQDTDPDSAEGIAETGHLIEALAARHREFSDKLAERQTLMIRAEDLDYEDVGPVSCRPGRAFGARPGGPGPRRRDRHQPLIATGPGLGTFTRATRRAAPAGGAKARVRSGRCLDFLNGPVLRVDATAQPLSAAWPSAVEIASRPSRPAYSR